jgi:hypothetical protein
MLTEYLVSGNAFCVSDLVRSYYHPKELFAHSHTANEWQSLDLNLSIGGVRCSERPPRPGEPSMDHYEGLRFVGTLAYESTN